MRKKLKNKREELNLSHKQIADMIGISRSYYTRIENGASNLTFKLVIKIKKITDYQNDDLFENTSENNK